jgi:DNA-binding LacI/PurR family transcriptional regulator
LSGTGIDPRSPLPRYYQIYSALRGRIVSGELLPGQALPPERQIAEAYGVARLTAIKALDLLERDGLIDRQHGRGTFVQEPAQASGRFADTIAFISFLTFTHELLMGISQESFERGYHLQLLGVDTEFRHLDAYVDACVSAGVNGFLIFGRPDPVDAACYERLLAQGVPLVMVDRYYPGLECDRAVYDNEEAAFELVSRMIARGHESIAVLPGPEPAVTSVQDRLAGYRRALESRGIAYDEDLVWLDIYDRAQPGREDDDACLDELLRRLGEFGVSALLTINDSVADSVLQHGLAARAARPSGDLPPLDRAGRSGLGVELATFSDRARSDLDLLALHPGGTLGRTAAGLLIDRLAGEVTGPPKHLVVPMEIIEYPKPATPPVLGRTG